MKKTINHFQSKFTLWCVWGALLFVTPSPSVGLFAFLSVSDGVFIAPLQMHPSVSASWLLALLLAPCVKQILEFVFPDKKRLCLVKMQTGPISVCVASASVFLLYCLFFLVPDSDWLRLLLSGISLPSVFAAGAFHAICLFVWSADGVVLAVDRPLIQAQKITSNGCAVLPGMVVHVPALVVGCCLPLFSETLFLILPEIMPLSNVVPGVSLGIGLLMAWLAILALLGRIHASEALSRQLIMSVLTGLASGLLVSGVAGILAPILASFIYDNNAVVSMFGDVPMAIAVASARVLIVVLLLSFIWLVAVIREAMRAANHAAKPKSYPEGCPKWMCMIPGVDRLSPRELQVLSALGGGRSHSEVAALLGISSGAVGTYTSRGLKKLGMASTDALRVFFRSYDLSNRAVESEFPPKVSRTISGLACFLILWSFVVIPPPRGMEAVFLSVYGAIMLSVAMGLSCSSRIEPGDMGDVGRTESFDGSLPAYVKPFVIVASVILGVTAGRAAIEHDSFYRFLSLVSLTFMLLMVGNVVFKRLCGIKENSVALRFGYVLIEASILICEDAAVLMTLLSSFCLATSIFRTQDGASFALKLGSIVLVALMIVSGIQRLRDDLEVSSPLISEQDRALLYMRGRGLSDTESNVLLRISMGMGIEDLCQSLSIAPGTVNTCRRMGYKKLAIHSKLELRDILQKDAGLRFGCVDSSSWRGKGSSEPNADYGDTP